MTKLRVGMLGVGGVAAKYVGLYQTYPRSQLVTVFDTSAEAAAASARNGVEVAPSEEALIASDVDAIVISTPNFLHARQTKAALAAGKHVLLQKPMTLTAAEAQELAEAAETSGKRLGIYMNSLDNAVFRDVKAMVTAGVLGHIGSINAKLANGMGGNWSGKTPNFWRGSRAATGGGSFAMLAYHYINLCQWLLDAPIASVMARGKNLMSPHIEGDDIMCAIAEFRGGAMGVIESAWCVRGEQFSIHGSTGSLAYIDNLQLSLKANAPFEGEVIRYTSPGQRVLLDGLAAPAMDAWQNQHNQHRQFIDAILDGTPMPVPPLRGVQDMRVLEAAYRSSRSERLESVEAVW